MTRDEAEPRPAPTGPAVLPDPARLAPRIVEACRVAAAPFEFRTFLLGLKVRRAPLAGAALEAWKGEVKRRAGAALEDEWAPLGRAVAFRRPELLLEYDFHRDRVELRIRSLFFYGRYRKLVRDLPQTSCNWPCPACRPAGSARGKAGESGCPACGGTGLRHPTALVDLLGAPCARACGSRRYELHGMGREDVDVRCLGPGRPFVLEVLRPRRRRLDLTALAAEVEADGRVALPSGLREVGDEVVARIKAWQAPKRYLARCEAGSPLEPGAVLSLGERLTGQLVTQRTPVRVAHRRADLLRPRRLLEVRARPGEGGRFELEVEAESGTYIKELISGDDGRTEPSVSALLGVPCRCVELDVLEIRADDAALLADPAPLD